jgi:hypothetical protein
MSFSSLISRRGLAVALATLVLVIAGRWWLGPVASWMPTSSQLENDSVLIKTRSGKQAEQGKAVKNSNAASDSTAASLRSRILAGESWRTVYHDIKTITDPALRDAMFQLMVETLFENDPGKLAAMLHAGGLDPALVRKVGPLLAESIRKVGTFNDLPESLGLLGNNFIVAASLTEPRMALDWVNHNTTGLCRDIALLSVTAALARQAPAEALRQLDTIQNEDSKGESAREIGRSWGLAGDAAGALNWAKSLPEGELRTKAMEGTLAGISQRDPKSVITEIAAYATHPDFAYVGGLMGDSLAQKDPRGGMDIISQLPEGPVKQQAMQSSLQKWGQKNFTEAEAYVRYEQAVTPGEMRHLYWGAGAETQPDVAWQKIQTYTDPQQRQQAMAGYVEGHLLQAGTNNPAPMIAFVNALPAGPERDYAQAELTNYYFSAGDPAKSWDHALQVQTPDLRVEAIFAAWWITENHQGVDAANNQLSRTQLSKSQLNQLQTMATQLYTGGVGAVEILPLGFKPGGIGHIP